MFTVDRQRKHIYRRGSPVFCSSDPQGHAHPAPNAGRARNVLEPSETIAAVRRVIAGARSHTQGGPSLRHGGALLADAARAGCNASHGARYDLTLELRAVFAAGRA
ncbi:hypothetical protein PsYK624_026120 [Phanerochaete sordida]|uniref:Uncharacterized protein n=1 Tax=Phanerochaete sordida TaxID=48140 RepID=A0A9P3LA91_9APHY|nr:hypothetical protein PsYK624_026120 [Phanerochaete sordida]